MLCVAIHLLLDRLLGSSTCGKPDNSVQSQKHELLLRYMVQGSQTQGFQKNDSFYR